VGKLILGLDLAGALGESLRERVELAG